MYVNRECSGRWIVAVALVSRASVVLVRGLPPTRSGRSATPCGGCARIVQIVRGNHEMQPYGVWSVHQPALYSVFIIVSGFPCPLAAAASAAATQCRYAVTHLPHQTVYLAAAHPNRAGRPICATVPRASYRWGRSSLSLSIFFFRP